MTYDEDKPVGSLELESLPYDDKPLTVADLRKALEGLPDDMFIATYDESWLCFVYETAVGLTKPKNKCDLGDIIECRQGEPGTLTFIIGTC